MGQLFFLRLIANRPDFPASLTAEEQATMGAHAAYLKQELAAGTLVVAGPVLDPRGVFGVGVFEAASMEAMQAIAARDPALALGRHEILPMGPGSFRRPAR